MSNAANPDESEPGPYEVYCRDCGTVIDERAEICPNCGVRQRDPPKSSLDTLIEELTAGGNPFIAAVLSVVFPGLGQLYNRELEKGLVVMVASVVALVSVVVGVGVVLYPAVWIYALWDAYKVAERQSATETDTEDVAAVTSEEQNDETDDETA